MIMKNTIFILFIVCLTSCYPKYYTHLREYKNEGNNTIPDYAKLNNWAAHPKKIDPADSIPSNLKNYTKDSSVDVFYIHPTSFTDPKITHLTNADINNDSINAVTDYGSVLFQASAFNSDGKVYAPRYRQAYIGMYYTKDTAKAIAAFDIAYSDVKTAFEYYLKNNNNNRPIVIAAHSQGTDHAKRLLHEFFDDKPLKNQLVIAYLIGMPIKEKEFKNIPVCLDSTKTGCFVTWRTFRTGVEIPKRSTDKIAVVNPLSWNTDTSYYDFSYNSGGVLFNLNKRILKISDAQIHDNILWINKPKFFGSVFFTQKNYHVVDYNLFYYNIREDVRRRIKYYTLNNQKISKK